MKFRLLAAAGVGLLPAGEAPAAGDRDGADLDGDGRPEALIVEGSTFC
jgi:hypothetical protein